MIKISYFAALDLSSDEAAFAVTEQLSGEIIIEQFRPMTGRNSAILTPWIIELLNNAELDLADIAAWTIGSGPGSFTGMRLAAAVVEGFMLGQAKKSRCVPTAFAMAASSRIKEKTAVIFDGRNHELLLFGVERNSSNVLQKTGKATVFNRETVTDALSETKYQNITALKKDAAALEKILPQHILSQVIYQAHIPVTELINASSQWNNDLTALCYIRPAVFTHKNCYS